MPPVTHPSFNVASPSCAIMDRRREGVRIASSGLLLPLFFRELQPVSQYQVRSHRKQLARQLLLVFSAFLRQVAAKEKEPEQLGSLTSVVSYSVQTGTLLLPYLTLLTLYNSPSLSVSLYISLHREKNKFSHRTFSVNLSLILLFNFFLFTSLLKLIQKKQWF